MNEQILVWLLVILTRGNLEQKQNDQAKEVYSLCSILRQKGLFPK